MTILDQLTDDLDSRVVDTLGDPVIYRAAASPIVARYLNAFVDHGDQIERMAGNAVVVGSIQVRLRVSDVPLPEKGDMIELPRRGETVRVLSWQRDPSGRWWIIEVARK